MSRALRSCSDKKHTRPYQSRGSTTAVKLSRAPPPYPNKPCVMSTWRAANCVGNALCSAPRLAGQTEHPCRKRANLLRLVGLTPLRNTNKRVDGAGADHTLDSHGTTYSQQQAATPASAAAAAATAVVVRVMMNMMVVAVVW